MALRAASMGILKRQATVTPPGTPTTRSFRCSLVRQGEHEKWGVAVVVHPRVSGLSILEVEDTDCIRQWNREHEPLQAGYSIVEVNGFKDVRSMTQQFRSANQLELLINKELTEEQQWALQKSMQQQKVADAIDRVIEDVHPKSCDETCCICHDDMDANSAVVRLPCKHRFHRTCATKWLVRRQRCPLCNHHLSLDLDDLSSA